MCVVVRLCGVMCVCGSSIVLECVCVCVVVRLCWSECVCVW